MGHGLSFFFDASGQLTPQGMQACVEAMRQRRLESLPDPVYQYIHENDHILQAILIRYEAETPLLILQPEKNRSLTVIIVSMAILLLISVVFWTRWQWQQVKSEETQRLALQDSIAYFKRQSATIPNNSVTVTPVQDTLITSPLPEEKRVAINQESRLLKIIQEHPENFVFDESNPGNMMGGETETPKIHFKLLTDSVLVNRFELSWQVQGTDAPIMVRILSKDRQNLGMLSTTKTLTSEHHRYILKLNKEELQLLTSGGYWVVLYPPQSTPIYQKVWYYRLAP